ncbi:MAG: DUF998 domain-containing protein [Butyricicoccus sp.]|nr:DUF998 domain-containing protein [Butyricicoccus sp.]
MSNLLSSLAYNVLLLLTVGGEFVLPWILGHFWRAYDPKTTVMSVLGSPQSPVRGVYNAWLIWLGCFLSLTALARWDDARSEHPVIAAALLVSIGLFAVGAGLLAGLFSVNENRAEITTASKIHGAGSALGFTALLFFPLADALLAIKRGDGAGTVVGFAAFAAALCCFTAFIMGDKERFRDTALARAGVWERASLLCMYAPFVFDALRRLLVGM